MRRWISATFVLVSTVSILTLTGCGGYFGCRIFGRCGDKQVSAAASAGDALFVTATAHVAGAQGTNWRSDVEVHSLGTEAANFSISLLEHGADNSSPDTREMNLASGQTLRLGDILASEFGVQGLAALILRPSSGRIIVTSRTYNLLGENNALGLPSGSTFGQYIPAQPLGEAIGFGEQGRLIQLSHSTSTDGGSRTNLGLVNATDVEVRIEVTLFEANGNELGTVPEVLPAFGYRQLNRVFDRVSEGDIEDGYALVRTTSSEGLFFAYASVVDNLTGDPVAISAVRLPENAPSTVGKPLYVVATAHVAGDAGTNWRSDVEVHCWSDHDAAYTVELLKHGRDNSSAQSRTFSLAAGESVRYEDILETVFGFEGGAALRISATEGRLLVTSRTYNLLGEGDAANLPAGSTFGQYIPGVDASEAIGFGEEGRLIQLSHTPGGANGFRTNLVLVNATPGEINTSIELFESDGTLLGVISRALAPYEYRQLNKVFEDVTGDTVADGYVVVRTTTEGGEFFALASVVDNLTGDPVGMSAPVIMSTSSEEVLGRVEEFYDALGQTDLEDFVDRTQDLGIDGLLGGLVAAESEVAFLTANGMEFDYGDGYLAPDGTTRSGSIVVDVSGVSVDSNGITGTMSIIHDQLLIDGEPPAIGSSDWTFGLSELPDGTVAGDVTVGSPDGKSSGSLSGTIVIDTAICLEYPISGSLTATVEGELITINFGPDCDGSVDHDIGEAPGVFDYSFGSPASPQAREYIDSSTNAEVVQEGTVWYWRPSMGGETFGETPPAEITFHFPFESPVSSGRLLLQISTFHWSYSRGHGFVYGSTNGNDWVLLQEVLPPDFGGGRGGGWNGELPELFIGATDIWFKVQLFAYGPSASAGGVYCNTAQFSRWNEGQTTNSFELEVRVE